MARHNLLSLGAVLIAACAQLLNVSTARSSEDFYVWDAQMPQQAGVLLRQEPLEAELVLGNAGHAYRILYSSEGFAGDIVAVSGAVFVPAGEPPRDGWPVLAWSHGTVGIADKCAPSLQGRSERDISYLQQWLAAGYAVVATDYEGLGTPGTHPYLHCQSEANGNIDAVHAAQGLSAPLGKRWLVTGQSQGGQGALCTGAHVGQRESDLEFLGTLATAPGVNFMARFRAGGADEPNPFIGIALLLGRGFETYEPAFKREEAFTEQALAMMPYTDSACVMELIGMGMKANLTSGQTLRVIPFSEAPGVAQAARHMEIPEQGWTRPVYIAQGTQDELVRYSDVVDFARSLCEQDVEVFFDVYEGADHSGPMNQGVDRFIRWADARFAGQPGGNNCASLLQTK